jgi:HK97 family phage major capsid protein
MSELERAVQEVNDSLDDFKKRHSARLDKLEVKLREPVLRPVNSAKGYYPETEEQKVFSTYLREGDGRLDGYEKKTLRVADDTLGGYVCPPEFRSEIIEKLTEYSPIRKLATVMETSGSVLEIPRETGQFDAGWIGEISERTETTGMTFGLERIVPHEAYCFVKIARTLLEDSAINLDSFLARKFAQRLGKTEATAFISGNETCEPEGILANANVTSCNSGNATTLTTDGLIDMCYDLPSAYRANACWLMNRYTVATVRKLLDGQNNYIWEKSYAAGEPPTLLGFKVYECPELANVANAEYPIVFGDLEQAYTIVDRIFLNIARLVERYIELGVIGFQARRRVGGAVVLPEALRKMLIST